MLTRAKKKQKIEHYKLQSLATVFPHLVQFLTVNDTTTIGKVCKELRRSVNLSYNGSCRILKEERLSTRIGFEQKTFEDLENLGPDFQSDLVTVSQIHPFHFWALDTSTNPPKKLKAVVNLQNDLWEELDNQKVRDFPAPKPTRCWISVSSVSGPSSEEENLLLCSFPQLGRDNDVWPSFMSGKVAEYGLWLGKFQENGSEEHKGELRRMLALLYAFTKCISTHSNKTIAYPSAEYLMRQLPEVVWPFFPQDFDWEADPTVDRTTVPEFSYHPAPDWDAWLTIMEDTDFGMGPNNYPVDNLPWYDPSQADLFEELG